MMENSGTSISCGVRQMFDLYEGDTIDDQIDSLDNALINSSQVIFSDTMDSTECKELKRFSFKGPITVNPNSGNRIRVYIATRGTLAKLRALKKSKKKK